MSPSTFCNGICHGVALVLTSILARARALALECNSFSHFSFPRLDNFSCSDFYKQACFGQSSGARLLGRETVLRSGVAIGYLKELNRDKVAGRLEL